MSRGTILVADDDRAIRTVLDHALGRLVVGHGIEVRGRLAAFRLDFVDDFLGRRPIGALAGAGAAKIVDDDLRARTSELKRHLASDTTPRARDQGDLVHQ